MTLPTLRVELGLGGVPAGGYLLFNDPTVGFEVGVFAPSTFYTNANALTSSFPKGRVKSGKTNRGRSTQLEEYTAGKCNFELDDKNGDYDPNNLSGPWVSGGVTLLNPNVSVRVSAEHPAGSGTVYPIATMLVDQFLGVYNDPKAQTALITGTDGFKMLARAEPSAPRFADGGSEDTGARVARVLDAAGWSRTARDLDEGSSTLQATTLATFYLSEIQDAVKSEFGHAFIGKSGEFVFRNRLSRLTATRSTVSQATFTDSSASALHYSSVTPNNSDALMKNSVSGQIAGGTVQEVIDTTSIDANGISSYNATNMWLETDRAAEGWAEMILGLNKTIEKRFDEITFDLLPNSTALFSALLPLEIGDLITGVRHTPAGTTITHDLFIEGIEWTFSGMKWGCTLRCSPARPYVETDFLRFNDGLQAFNTRVFAF